MGRHTTPGDGTTVQRDEVIGWGAFSTVVAGVLVGVLGGWFEAFGVLLLGGLATAALWFVRNHTAAGLGRGRHASDTPWSPTDLLELKDEEPAAGGRSRASKAPAGAAAKAAAKAPARTASATRRGGRRDTSPVAAGGADPLGWLPGGGAGPDGAPDDAPAPSRRSGRRAAPVVVESGGLVDTGGRPVLDASEPARQVPSPAGSALSGVPASRVHSEGLGPTPGFAPPIDPAPGRPVPAAREPLSRRSRRGAAPQPPQAPAGPARPVLPVAPFEMGAAPQLPLQPARPDGVRPPVPAPVAFAPPQPSAQGTLQGTLPVPTPMSGVAQVPGSGRFPTAPVPVVPAPLPPAATHSAPPVPPPPAPAVPPRPVTDPLSGPLNLDTVAAEPTVLDPALDPLWSAPAVELTVEQTPVPAAARPLPAPTPAVPAPTHVIVPEPAAVDLVEAEQLDARREQERQSRRADGPRAGSHRGAGERDRAAADLDPLWARRARRPEVRLPGAPRPAVRREPAPLEPIPGGPEPSAGDPYLVVLPEPDVPDVLMIPESDVVPTSDSAPRPAPGTLSLDELLVLHTRRPGARRSGSGDQAGETGGRPLE